MGTSAKTKQQTSFSFQEFVTNKQNILSNATITYTEACRQAAPVVRCVTFQNLWRDILCCTDERPFSRFGLVISIL